MSDNPLSSNPISNPPVSPVSPTPAYGPDQPRVGAGEEAQEPKPFSLGPEGGKTSPAHTTAARPSPMEVAGDSARQGPQIAPEELQDKIGSLKEKLGTVQNALQDPNQAKNLTPDHQAAMQRLTEKMNPDMKKIADTTEGTFNTPEKKQGQSPLDYVKEWLGGTQGTLSGALDYLATTESPNIGNYLRLQYAVQRSAQKGELFASIIGSTVSGVKTLMSTQIG